LATHQFDGSGEPLPWWLWLLQGSYLCACFVAPVVAGELSELTGTFDGSLMMVAAIMLLGLLSLLAMERLVALRAAT
jgi:hypothetical protein